MNFNKQIYYNIMASYFKWSYNTNYGKIPFAPVEGIYVNNGENVCIEKYPLHKMNGSYNVFTGNFDVFLRKI